jgi:ribonuclease HI
MKKKEEVISVRVLGRCLPKDFGSIACYAYIIRNKDGLLLHEACGLAAEPNSRSSTNNIATYTALIKALEWLVRHVYTGNIIITVRSSSKYLVSQLDNEGHHSLGQVSGMSKNIVPLHKKAMKLKSKFYKLSFELISSSGRGNDDDSVDMNNEEIEELAVLAYTEAKEKILRANSIDEQKIPFVTAAQLMKHNREMETISNP